ncbi:MAG: hypothetical protein FVQ77_05550 [Cytophagales bacterium]|nr:hypothetical protein [Cytophagales bacterium]
MNKLINILQNPLFIALVVAAIIIPFLPQSFDKYKMELVDSETVYVSPDKKSWNIILYNDLDNDGKSEKVRCGFSPILQLLL